MPSAAKQKFRLASKIVKAWQSHRARLKSLTPTRTLRNPPNTSTTEPRDRATRPLRGCFARRVTRVTCADRGRATVSELDFAKLTPKTVWPSGLRRWLQAPVRKGVGSNPTAVTLRDWRVCARGPVRERDSARPTRAAAPGACVPVRSRRASLACRTPRQFGRVV